MNQRKSVGDTETDEDHKTGVKLAGDSENKKKYRELMDAGFQPPAHHFHSLRSSKRPRRESPLSEDNIDLKDTNRIPVDAISEIDCDDLSDVKPPASTSTNKRSSSNIGNPEKCSSLKPKADVPEKVTKKRVVERSDEQPFQLHHRLFEPIGGRVKRTNSRSVAGKSLNEQPRKRIKSKRSKRSNEDDDASSIVESSSKPFAKQPLKVELPVNAVIRGSITHRVLLKVKRLDSQCLYDDPYQQCQEIGDEVTTKTPAMFSESTPSTKSVYGQDDKLKHERDVLSDDFEVPLRVCVRSAVIPQKSTKISHEKYRIVLLHGPHRGKTGYIVDEIDGKMSVIQSDDPNSDQVATWTVNNLAISTVDEYQEAKPRSQFLPPLTKEAVDLEQFKLFLTCLDEELGFAR